jgi:hypothetical protein
MGEIELHSTKRMIGLISIAPQMATVSESAILYIDGFFVSLRSMKYIKIAKTERLMKIKCVMILL